MYEQGERHCRAQLNAHAFDWTRKKRWIKWQCVCESVNTTDTYMNMNICQESRFQASPLSNQFSFHSFCWLISSASYIPYFRAYHSPAFCTYIIIIIIGVDKILQSPLGITAEHCLLQICRCSKWKRFGIQIKFEHTVKYARSVRCTSDMLAINAFVCTKSTAHSINNDGSGRQLSFEIHICYPKANVNGGECATKKSGI